MRAFIDVAVRRRVSVIMAALAVIAFGLVAYDRLSLELFPDITYPSLTVQTEFPDTAPQEVENLVTRPVEEAVGVLRGLQTIHSVSRAGVSEVTLEFAWGSDMDQLSMEVREKLDRLLLPEETTDPVVLRYDPSLEPIVRLALSGPAEGSDLQAMRRLADKQIKQDFETIKGVAAAQIKGGLEEEIQVDLDQNRLAALGLTIDQVQAVVGVSNVNLPGGALRGQDSQFLIRTINEFRSTEEIADLIIRQDGNATVRLREVADVTWGSKEREEITRVGGRESVEVSIFKEGDANTVAVARLLQERLAEWQGGKLPPDHELTVLFDQSQFIKQAIDEVRSAALIGGVLAIVVLLVFLRDLRSTLIIATSIPISVIATFVAMYKLDISLNIMSLGGLTLGIGMLVDNSIVVLESVYRKRQLGASLFRAAVDGSSEVAAAVVASTLTTVAVFLPIVFVEGIAGQLFRDQALTVSVSLIASLIVAITLIPMLSAAGSRLPLKHERESEAGGASSSAGTRLETGPVKFTLGWFSALYDGFLKGAISRSALTLVVAFALFFGSIYGVRYLGTELIPQLSEGEFFFEVNLPEGASLAATDRTVARMEEAAAVEPGVEKFYATVGSRLASGGMSVNTKAENLAQLNIVMADRGDDVGELVAAEDLRRAFVDLPDVEIKFGRPSYFSLKTPVEVIIYGEDLAELRSYSLEVARALEGVTGLVDVRSSLEAGNPELQVVFDRDRLASLGLNMGVLSETLKNRVLGVVPTRFREADRQIDIRIRNREEDRQSLQDVRSLVIPGPDGTPLRLLSVAEVTEARGPAEIHRLQQQRAAVVSANLEGRSLGGAMADVQDVLAGLPRTPGLSTELGGQNQEMETSFNSLRFAIGLAIFLVYLVMAATFESFLHPFLVLFTIPLALVGVVAGLWLTGTTVTVIVLIGTIMLVGIVVNNAIVLIDTINRLRRAGLAKRDAVIRGGHLRLRPILMTTLTTILGLLPMALSWGEGAELRAPLAITVASGLLLSTLLTLVVIPAAYALVPSRVDAETEMAEPEPERV